MSENWFDRVTDKLMSEFTGLFAAGAKVLNLPNKTSNAHKTKENGKLNIQNSSHLK